MIFAADAASAELLNARYPSKYDLNAIQLATLADDGEMIQKLLQIEGLQMSDPFQKDQHPLLLGFRSGSHKAVTTLLKDIRISEQPELISVFFGNVIMDEVPADVLVSYLDAYNSDIKDELISKMLLPALMRKNKEIMEVLLKAGASPTAVIVDNKTAWDIAKEQEEVDIMLLFKRYQ
jgi:ankyrin repeat protein